MAKIKQYLKISIAALCVILILAYAFIVFLPHSHGGVCDSDCITCALIEKAEDALFAFLCCAAIYQMLDRDYLASGDYYSKLSVKEATPVVLKVKLSN